jgi:hypothetical protein
VRTILDSNWGRNKKWKRIPWRVGISWVYSWCTLETVPMCHKL